MHANIIFSVRQVGQEKERNLQELILFLWEI